MPKNPIKEVFEPYRNISPRNRCQCRTLSVLLYFIFIIFIFGELGCKSIRQKSNNHLFEYEPMTLNPVDTVANGGSLIKRNNLNFTSLMILEKFDDTVVVELNDREVFRNFVHENNNPFTSSGQSGFVFSLNLKSTKNSVSIKLINQRKVIQFEIDKKFPLYTIQRYDSHWYISPRIYTIVFM